MTLPPGYNAGGGSAEVPQPPALAGELLGPSLGAMEHFAAILARRGVHHGLIGPREVPRLWDRHIINCALLAEVIPLRVRVIDVGTGAGLPGLVLAIARPDLRVDLVEPLERRVRWLETAIAELGLASVQVHRGKADAFWNRLAGEIVTARAVARLAELARWCLPLVPPGGQLLAMKGASVAREIQEDHAAMVAAGADQVDVLTLGEGRVEVPTRVVRVVRGQQRSEAAATGRSRGKNTGVRGSTNSGGTGRARTGAGRGGRRRSRGRF